MPTHAQDLKLYVAPNGNDTWSGRLAEPRDGDGPFATLERARDELRKMKQSGALPDGGAVVELRAGIYERGAAFELTAEDSGTEAGPIVYRARPGEEVRLVGGKRVTNFAAVTDDVVLGRLDEAARGKVLQADLKALGITDFGEVAAGGKRLELFFQDKPMQIARWPNEGFIKIADILNIEPRNVRGTKGDKVGKFIYDSERPARWTEEMNQ